MEFGSFVVCGIGVCVMRYTMVTGVPPFVAENIKKLSEAIMFKEPDYNVKTLKYEFALKDLLKRMLYG